MSECQNLNSGYDIDVGGGLLLGAFGAMADDFVINLGLVFLNTRVDHIEIGEINYDSDPTGASADMSPVSLLESSFGNPRNSTSDTTFSVIASELVTKSTTWDQTTMDTFGSSMSIDVSAEAFGVGVKGSFGFEWSKETSSNSGGSNRETITVGNTIGPLTLKPGHGKNCKIFVQKGEGNFPYTSTVTVKLADGYQVSYTEKGNLKSVQYSQAMSSCTDNNHPIEWDGIPGNLPQGVTVQGKD